MSFIFLIVNADWWIAAAWRANSAAGQSATLGWWCLPQVRGGPLAMRLLSLIQCTQRNSKKLMLILSVNLATKKPPQTNKPHASRTEEHKFIWVEDRTFCCCSVGKVFPAAHSSLPLIWTISLFSGDILLYNSNLDIWNLLGMFHGSSKRDADPLGWRLQPRRLTAC